MYILGRKVICDSILLATPSSPQAFAHDAILSTVYTILLRINWWRKRVTLGEKKQIVSRGVIVGENEKEEREREISLIVRDYSEESLENLSAAYPSMIKKQSWILIKQS